MKFYLVTILFLILLVQGSYSFKKNQLKSQAHQNQVQNVFFNEFSTFNDNNCLKTHMEGCLNEFLQNSDENSSQELIQQIKVMKSLITNQQNNKIYMMYRGFQKHQNTGNFWKCSKIAERNICQKEMSVQNFLQSSSDIESLKNHLATKVNTRTNPGEPNTKFSLPGEELDSDSEEDLMAECLEQEYMNCCETQGLTPIDFETVKNIVHVLDKYLQSEMTEKDQEDYELGMAQNLVGKFPMNEDAMNAFFECMLVGFIGDCAMAMVMG